MPNLLVTFRSLWFALVLLGNLCLASLASGTLARYDEVVGQDAVQGVPFLARLTNTVVLTGANQVAFNFGNTAGNVTMEFILEGDPVNGAASKYLAVGANTSSNLRYEQWNNTGQMGFTQLGVLDYLFSPTIPSPTVPVHVAYVWNNGTKTMRLYLNGTFAGSRSGVTTSFAMPTGQGFLGANPGNSENMIGTVYRVTVYNSIIDDAAILRHADAFNDVIRLPIIASFEATPEAIFTPESATLAWSVIDADAIFIDGTDVTALPQLVVSPQVTTTYTLTATNGGGSVNATVTVLVNPSPVIDAFTADALFGGSGDPIELQWVTRYGNHFSIEPGVGDVTLATTGGIGAQTVTPLTTTTFTLTVSNQFGVTTAEREIRIVQPADHLVINEFMADDESILADEDGDFSGWIEIHNPTPTPVDLLGHYLTDDDDDPLKWALPQMTLDAGAYLVVFASGKDRTNTLGNLHTSFGLRNKGEYLALVGPGPVLLHAYAPEFPPQRPDISYGLLGADPALETFMGIPTPGTANVQSPPPPAPVEFSRDSGMFTSAFSVSLSTLETNAVIWYTTDGSEPGPGNGTLYESALPITATTRLRAVAVVGGQSSRITGVQFIRLASSLADYASSLPILVVENFGAGVIPQKGWNGTGAGIRQLPRQDAVWATFNRVNGTSSMTNAPQMFSRIGIRGRGAFSTSWRQKPYSVEAIDQHGEELDVAPLDLPAHADWVLYFPDPDDNKDPTLMFNTFAYKLSANTGRYSVRFRWVEVFVNEDGGDLTLTDRRGVYAIIEKVSRGKNRLDFERLSADGTSGGWLLNINRMDPEPEGGWPAPNGATQPWYFHTAGPNRIQQTPANTPGQGDDIPRQSNGFINFDNPNGYKVNDAQRAAIEDWFRQFEDVLYNNAIWRDPALGYRQYLDDLDFIDYFILNVLTRNGDGLLISFFPWKGDDGKLRIGPAWDYNWSSYYISGGPTGSLMHRSDRVWYARLFNDPDFHQRYIDRWWEMRAGPMSNAAMEAVIDDQAADITPQKALLNGLPSESAWADRLDNMKSWLTTRANWIDSNYLRPPVFSQNGGSVPDGFPVVVLGTNGSIYVTIDGSDPREPGGGIAISAAVYSVPIPINATTHLKARVYNGGNWSGLASAVFYPPQDLGALALTEIMYDPPDFGMYPGAELEFIELKNTGTALLNLGNLSFTDGIQFTFPSGTSLAPGDFVVLARNPAAFQAKYPGVLVDGAYTGRLDNGGETIRLSTVIGSSVLAVDYDNRAPWPIAANGYGFSIVPFDAGTPLNSDDGMNWRASTALGGSPGADDPDTVFEQVVINELLTHTDPPQIDSIELLNLGNQTVDLGGWFLSDDGAFPMKYRIPAGTLLAPGGYEVFTEDDFNPMPGTLLNFSLNSTGDSAYLSSGDAMTNLTGYSHGIDFGAAANGVSFGRYVSSDGREHFPAQTAITLRQANAGPRVGPVVIQEIHYHPQAPNDEFLELRNITAGAVMLFDAAHATNAWGVNGIGYTFPTGVSIPAGGQLLLVADDPGSFRLRHGIDAAVPILGPYPGVLQDSGERLTLERPDAPNTNGIPRIAVDVVRYNDRYPWPAGADGSGASLQRRMIGEFGNDPTNWVAATPTPGTDFVPGQPPVITEQPLSQTIVAFQSAQFTVGASGNPSFQWLFNGSPIAGATSDTLLLTNVNPELAGAYRAVVFNSFGSVLSDEVMLVTLQPAFFLQQPSDITTNAGETVVFSVTALGTGTLFYQWQKDGVDVPGAVNNTLTLENIQLADDGVYSVVVTDDVGPVSSDPARLTVLAGPEFLHGPQTLNVAPGRHVVLSVTTTGTLPISYRWRRGFFTIAQFELNSHVSFLSLTNVQAGDAGLYTVVATNVANFTPGVLSPSGTLAIVTDTDGDLMTDEWEARHNLNPDDPGDAVEDGDGDGMTNLEEHIAGTDPGDGASYLKIEQIESTGGVRIEFNAASNQTYTVEYSDHLPAGQWNKLVDLAHRPASGPVVVRDPAPTATRYYRLVTPRQE